MTTTLSNSAARGSQLCDHAFHIGVVVKRAGGIVRVREIHQRRIVRFDSGDERVGIEREVVVQRHADEFQPREFCRDCIHHEARNGRDHLGSGLRARNRHHADQFVRTIAEQDFARSGNLHHALDLLDQRGGARLGIAVQRDIGEPFA